MSLLPYCNTEKEIAYVTAYEEKGNQWTAIAQQFDKRESTIRTTVKRVMNRAALQGWSPDMDMNHPVPDTHIVKGVSTLYDDAGMVKQQWVKSDVKKESILEALQAAVEAMKEDIRPIPPVDRKTPESGLQELLTLYPIFDAHFGMLAWAEEGGHDWDLTIAEDTITKMFEQMMIQSPHSRECIIANGGDALHYSGMIPVTPTHGHVLDSDSRFAKIVRVVIRVIRKVVDMALMKHDHVHLVNVAGNHDDSAAVWLRELFAALYEDNPRITVETSPKLYNAHQFGNVMIGFHHGHKKKNAELPLLFAAEYGKMWGATEWRYVHTGHRHHQEVKEHAGMTVEQHGTLAARDAHASSGGWMSQQKATSITYHKQHGEVSRVTVNPAMMQ